MKKVLSVGLFFVGMTLIQANPIEDFKGCHAYACQVVQQYENSSSDEPSSEEIEGVYDMAYEDCAQQ